MDATPPQQLSYRCIFFCISLCNLLLGPTHFPGAKWGKAAIVCVVIGHLTLSAALFICAEPTSWSERGIRGKKVETDAKTMAGGQYVNFRSQLRSCGNWIRVNADLKRVTQKKIIFGVEGITITTSSRPSGIVGELVVKSNEQVG